MPTTTKLAAQIATSIAIPLLLLLAANAQGENWPQWRGSANHGSSPTADPPIEWSAEHNIRWRVEVPGQGSSTPIIWEDKVFLLTAIRTDRVAETSAGGAASGVNENEQFGTEPKPSHYYQFVVICYDRSSGGERWRRVAVEAVPHEGGHLTNTFASSSPVTDGQRLWVSFGSRGIFCFDLDGNEIWKQNLGVMETRRGFGEASSPALGSGFLVVPWDHEGQSFVAGLDAETGHVRWKTDRDELTTWATPLIVEHRGRQQVITNGSIVRSYDLATGELIWSCGGQVSNPIPCPMALDGVVYCMTGYRGNAVYAISLDARGDVTDSRDDVLWSRDDAAPYVSSAALYEGRIYLTKSRSSILSVLDAKTGRPIIDQRRLSGMDSLYASPVAAAGRVYFSSREGSTVVIRAGDEGEVLATNQLGETIDASPAVVDDQLFIRGSRHLFCIEQSAR